MVVTSVSKLCLDFAEIGPTSVDVGLYPSLVEVNHKLVEIDSDWPSWVPIWTNR